MSEREEVLLQHAYVLHHRPFRNTSLILDCITRDFGRVGLVSQGARRARGGNRALLQPFTRLRVSWIRRADLGRLTHVEAAGPTPPITGDGLLAGFYLNELLLRLVARGDADAQLFGLYESSLARLGDSAQIARTVRLFEFGLLASIGYHIELDRDYRSGLPVAGDGSYVLDLESGVCLAQPEQRDDSYPGHHLLSLHRAELADDASLRSAKRLLRAILGMYIGERPLRSRDVIRDVVGTRKRSAAEMIK